MKKHVLLCISIVVLSILAIPQLLATAIPEVEPNNEESQPQHIPFPAEITGTLKPDDSDVYQLEVTGGELEALVVKLSITGDYNPRISLKSQSRLIMHSDFFDIGKDEYLTSLKLAPGSYCIVVTGEGSEGFSEAKYTLSVGPVQEVTQAEINKALGKALDFLIASQAEDGMFPGKFGESAAMPGLVMQALLGAECIKRNEWNAAYKCIDRIKALYHDPAKLESQEEKEKEGGSMYYETTMYEHAIAMIALIEAYSLGVREALPDMIKNGLDFIYRAQLTDERPASLMPVSKEKPDFGGWRYTVSSQDADLSVTGWQIIALIAAQKAGFDVPKTRLTYALDYVKRCYNKEMGEFAYDSAQANLGTGLCGMGALSLQLLGEPKTPEVSSALRAMFTRAPSWNGDYPSGYPFYYWYYGTRAAYLEGGDIWRIWSKNMCSLLVHHQNDDGSWNPNQLDEVHASEVYTTSLGALILEFCCGSIPIYMRTDKVPPRPTMPPRPEKAPPPPIEVDLLATVTDADNNYILDLEKDQFEILEDGEKQTIIRFSKELTPVSMAVVLDTSGSMKPHIKAVQEAASQFVAQIRPVDRVMIVEFSDQVRTTQSFSSDVTQLKAVIGKTVPKGGTALYDALIESVTAVKSDKGRNAVILLTDGRDENNPGTGPGSTHTYDQCLEMVKESGVTVYSLGLGKNIDQSVLESLSRETGGRAYFPPTVADLAEVYGLIAKELRSQYSLGYTSTNSNRDGKWRTIEVSVPEQAYTVRTKKGYEAPGDTTDTGDSEKPANAAPSKQSKEAQPAMKNTAPNDQETGQADIPADEASQPEVAPEEPGNDSQPE